MKQVSKRSHTVNYLYTLVLDMNNIMKISSVNHDMNDKGEEYGIVATALKIIGDILKKKDFDYCIAAYDGVGSGVLRWKIYKDYKANRDKNYEIHDPSLTPYDKSMLAFQKKCIEYSRNKRNHVKKCQETDEESFERQKLILQNILEELCIRQYEYENVEGDDIISYYVHNKRINEKVVIVSSDKDLTQLISDTVIIYNPRIKDFITHENSSDKLGIYHENVVVEKILCGDSSDNIKGIKGLGESTLIKLFPDLKYRKVTLEEILEQAHKLLDERIKSKKKPLQSLLNILNRNTSGIQGENIYEINHAIIDLTTPLLTKEAEDDLTDILYTPIDTSDRNIRNVYNIINEQGMTSLMDEGKFSDCLSPYSRIIMKEQRRYKEILTN